MTEAEYQSLWKAKCHGCGKVLRVCRDAPKPGIDYDGDPCSCGSELVIWKRPEPPDPRDVAIARLRTACEVVAYNCDCNGKRCHKCVDVRDALSATQEEADCCEPDPRDAEIARLRAELAEAVRVCAMCSEFHSEDFRAQGWIEAARAFVAKYRRAGSGEKGAGRGNEAANSR